MSPTAPTLLIDAAVLIVFLLAPAFWTLRLLAARRGRGLLHPAGVAAAIIAPVAAVAGAAAYRAESLLVAPAMLVVWSLLGIVALSGSAGGPGFHLAEVRDPVGRRNRRRR